MSRTCYGRCTVRSATLRGVKAHPVEVEVAVTGGLPAFNIVGMPDAAIKEAQVRIKAACVAFGFTLPAARIVVNLAPSSLRKNGSGFDLPIAVALLCATHQIAPDVGRGALVVGELSLQGMTRPIPGLLAYALCAKSQGLALLGPYDEEPMAQVEGLEMWQVPSLGSLRSGEFVRARTKVLDGAAPQLDFKDVAGHDIAKRALQIAATGEHGVLMVGPPGSGKTMLASRLPSILPPLTPEEQLEAAVIHSVAQEPLEPILGGVRPFRAPHHGTTLPGLIGGGTPIRPGEVTLAHHGVLFLDELAEFKPSVLQGIRQPLESGQVSITRADGNVVFPACFSLVAATNPCPCGFHGDREKECTCTLAQIRHYQNRIGGPILDRIDMHLEVSRLSSGAVLDTGTGTSSAALRDGVMAGREYRAWRLAHEDVDERLGRAPRLLAACRMEDQTRAFFETAASSQHLSGRGIVRVLSVARTIADLEQSDRVNIDHVCEALSYRMPEGE